MKVRGINNSMAPTTTNYLQEDNNNNLNNNNNNNDDEGKIITNFPYDIRPLDNKINCELLSVFKGERSGFYQVGDKKWFFPSGYLKNAHHYYNFKVKSDDVYVITFPRSGTTWTQEMVWLLNNDLNYDLANEISLESRFTFLEFSSFVHGETKKQFLNEHKSNEENLRFLEKIDYPGWKLLDENPGKRFIKTHLPFSLLPPDLLKTGCKVVYVARNPKDVAVSFYHLNRSIRTQGYIGNFPKFWEYFQNNLQPWTPYWEHIKEGWSKRNEDNVLFLFYENMNKDLRGCLRKMSEFFGKNYTEKQFEELEEHLRIENFRKNKSVNQEYFKQLGINLKNEENFVRKGQIGGWKNYFDPELNSKADEWIENNLKNCDFRFPNL